MATKRDLWEGWIERTLLADIQNPHTPDPVQFFDISGDTLETSDELDSYRYGKNEGDYLYLLYFHDESKAGIEGITPVYVGESSNIGQRIYQHYKRIADALPIEDWDDDGSWGSFGKYDHMALIYEDSELPLCVWILDVDELDAGPYGYETYRQELEAKLVGLVHPRDRERQTFANREFVPNRILHEMGKAGQDWLTSENDGIPRSRLLDTEPVIGARDSKADLWREWVKRYIVRDIESDSEADPIPLFETDGNGQVPLTERGRLQRSAQIDERIRREGKKCVRETGVRDDGYEGLLYVMYQLAETAGPVTSEAIIPRYIGKGEAYGKKNELSANFEEIALDRDATRSFARWGDGDYWHIGELSNAMYEGDTRKRAWASELFEPGTRTLTQPTYLWVQAWNPEQDIGPYGYPTTLAEVEALLIGVALRAWPEHLLNKSEVPSDAPIFEREYEFETVAE